MASAFYSFFGITKLNNEAKRFVLKGLSIIFIFIYFIMLTNTFYILYALTIVTGPELGIIFAIRFLIQGITDYPTGAVGDWIGQRWVLFVAALFYCAGFIVLSQATTFTTLLIAFMILALADGQQSGSFQAWMDNNYKIYAPEDNNRQIYTEMFGKFIMINQLLMAFAFITGGVIITTYGRESVFFIQGVIIGLLSLVFAFFINDHPSIKRTKPNLKSYFSLLGEGIATSYRNRTLRLVMTGFVISSAFMAIWGQLMLFPFYESYGKTDDFTGLLRSIIFISGAILTGLMATVVKKIPNQQKWLAIIITVSSTIFLWGIMLMHVLNPPTEVFEVISYIIVILTFILIGVPFSLVNVLMPRFYLDIIPDKNRNSVYSLMPTLIMFASVITVALGGFLLEAIGFNMTMLLLGAVSLIGGSISGKGILSHRSRITPAPTDELMDILEQPAEKDLLAVEETIRFIENIRLSDLQTTVPMTSPVSWHVSQSAKTWNVLMSIALEDGIITDEEQVLLDKIMDSILNYAQVLEEALEDGIITKNEEKSLLRAYNQISRDVHKIALHDTKISQDEMAILTKLANVIRKLRKTGQDPIKELE
ncbi:MAG: MFS transporter [Candidatus Hodarchaeales archaeon]|jgi:MFS family permease